MPSQDAEVAAQDTMQYLVRKIQGQYPDIAFAESAQFSWHAGKRQLGIKKSAGGEHGAWALLHELGHALLGHADYTYDVELLQMEALAWQKACTIAVDYGLEIDEDYLQDCLDTYRDWLHLRATCPTCHSRSLQSTPRTYHCFNCGAEWHVSRSRLCRPYRLKTV